MSVDPANAANESARPEHTVIETIQSLVLAFVLAMTFRGFVTEGFVIPTGSMAPTLMGRHLLAHSTQTGLTFPVGVGETLTLMSERLKDPMLGPRYDVTALDRKSSRPRMGDRILVLKSLYPFSEPQRFDVVVFKNPTDPNGEAGNYIKRLVGLPNESILLIDGDVFRTDTLKAFNFNSYAVQRKREHTQRAVWQPVHNSDFIPVGSTELRAGGRAVPYGGPVWTGEGWETNRTRRYRCDSADPTVLEWRLRERSIDDWTPYNMLMPESNDTYDVSDVRVAAAIKPDADGLRATFELEARSHIYQFILADGRATVRMRLTDGDPDDWTHESAPAPTLPGGRVTNVEFWHVDQELSIFVDGDLVVRMAYEWTILERLQYSTGLITVIDYNTLLARSSLPPLLRWRFEGSPLALSRVRVDRDLFYRPDRFMGSANRNPAHPDHEDLVVLRSPAFGTHTEKPAVLGPDHYFMLGDNSPASSDSRRWGSPHPVVAEQIDAAPFLVHRRLMLGKAWVVYFPSPYRLGRDSQWPIVPDFGRLRFIR